MWLWILQVMFQEDLMSTEIGPIRRLQVWRDCHPRARGSFVQAKFSCMCTSILLAGTCANLSLQPMYPHQQLWVHMSCAPNLAMSSPGPYAPPASLKVVLDQVNLCAKKWGKSIDASEPSICEWSCVRKWRITISWSCDIHGRMRCSSDVWWKHARFRFMNISVPNAQHQCGKECQHFPSNLLICSIQMFVIILDIFHIHTGFGASLFVWSKGF